MNAIVYLVRKSVKNSLLELLNKPGKLVMYILVVAAVAGACALSFFSKAHVDKPAPIFWFSGILFLFIALFVVIAVVKGLSGGDAIFEMNDVNLLFVSPVDTRRILLYGIVRMAKAAFAAGFFIFFQASSLANLGVGYGGVLLTFAAFLLSVVVMMSVSLVIYSSVNGRPRRKFAVKCATALLFLPLAAYAATRYFATGGDIIATVGAAVESPYMRFIPVAGWTAGYVTAFISGDAAGGLIFLGLNLLLFAGIFAYIMLTNPDYYEDVLVATETAYEKKRAIADGDINAATASPSSPGRVVKVRATGIPGVGASALFGKHTRESFRQNRLGFLTTSSLLIVAGAVIMARFIREPAAVLQMLMWLQIFLIGTGRGLKETFTHYIYMIPESSFSKIIWSNMEIMARTLMESVLIFGVSGVLLGVGVPLTVLCIATYTLFSLLLLSINYLSMRFTGGDMSTGLLVFIYYIAVIAAMAPGVAGAIFIGTAIVGGEAGLLVGLLVLSGWELAAGLGFFALSKGVLHDCDIARLKKG